MLCGFAAIAAGVFVAVPSAHKKNGPPWLDVSNPIWTSRLGVAT
jgi:hypothetical protein